MEANYRITDDAMWNEDVGMSKVYGIAVKNDRVHIRITDISPDREFVEEIVEACNRNGLAPEHLRDVIDDYLAIH